MENHENKNIKLREIINVNFGILGVEFCWALFTPNMSPILVFLGAKPSSLAFLWILPPLIGLIISPFIGHISDLTITPYGKRRPYIFFGIFGIFIMCFVIPFIKTLWVQAFTIIFLVAFLNIVHQPLRSLVADIIPKHQLTFGFSVHLIFVGLGAAMGSAMPMLFRETSLTIPDTHQPEFLTLSFFVAGILLLITGLVTCIKTKENLNVKRADTAISLNVVLKAIFSHFLAIPKIVKLIFIVQFLIWIGYFLVFAYNALSIAETKFGLPPGADVYNIQKYKEIMKKATIYNNVCFIYFQISSFLISFIIPFVTKWISRKILLSIVLLCGGVGLLSVNMGPAAYIPALIVLGMGFTSSIGIHLAMMTANLPKTQIGLNTGTLIVANCLPQIVAGLLAGPILKYLVHERVTEVIAYSGIFLIIGAVCNQFIHDNEK